MLKEKLVIERKAATLITADFTAPEIAGYAMFDVANDDNGWTTYSNGFDATYGWESVMMEMFEELAPVLEDGSDLFINCDDGVDVLVIKYGKCIQEK